MPTVYYKNRTVYAVLGNMAVSCDSSMEGVCALFDILRIAEWHFPTDVSGQPIDLIFKSQLKMGPIGCPETSVGKNHSALRKTP